MHVDNKHLVKDSLKEGMHMAQGRLLHLTQHQHIHFENLMRDSLKE